METLELDFVLSDETVNRYGFRILVNGIDDTAFMRNPVCLVQHKDEYLSVGKWKNLRKENGIYKGTVEFDGEDPDAVKLYKKYKNGYMSAVSISYLPLAETEEPSMLLSGQRYPTVTKSELLEISLVTVPGNSNAIRLLNREGKEVKLSMIINNNENQNQTNMSKTNEKTLEQYAQENQTLRNKLASELVKLHLDRGAITAEEVPFYEKNAADDFDGTKKVLELRSGRETGKPDETAINEMASTLVKLHFDRGAIAAPEVDFYTNSARKDYEGTKKALEARKGKETLDTLTTNLGGPKGEGDGQNDRSKWTYLEWYKKDMDGLMALKVSDQKRYNEILAAHKLSLSKSNEYDLEE